jgi:hypothetical protein
MRSSVVVVFAVTLAAACGDAADTASALEVSGAPDAARDAGNEASPIHSDASDAKAEPSASEAAPPVEASTPPTEAAPPSGDAPYDVAADVAEATVGVREAGADAASDRVTADAGGAADAPSEAGLVCSGPAVPCDSVNRDDAAIRATFTKPCTEGDRKCGGIRVDVVETVPMICRSGAWRLAGVWTGEIWSPFFMCSRGCAAGLLCDP